MPGWSNLLLILLMTQSIAAKYSFLNLVFASRTAGLAGVLVCSNQDDGFAALCGLADSCFKPNFSAASFYSSQMLSKPTSDLSMC
uniref:Putative secreted protein n=1 Tax=Ixodes ricinus TaxID=34613 RepID=A0A6B0UAI0_IXORI